MYFIVVETQTDFEATSSFNLKEANEAKVTGEIGSVHILCQ